MSQDIEDRVATLLCRGTDQLPAVDLARGALVRARAVRRRRRSGAAVTVTAAVVVVAATLVPMLRAHDDRAVRPDASSDASADASPGGRTSLTVPPLPRSVVTGALDPADVGRLPAADLSVPRNLTPVGAVATPPDRAVMVTKSRLGDQSLLYALDRARSWHRITVDAPADLPGGTGPSVTSGALSPDGRTAVLLGRSAAYVVDLDAGTTRRFRVAVPLAVAWQDDARHVRITAASGRSALLDARSWTATWATYDVGGLPLLAAYDGTTLVRRQELTRGGAAYVEQRDGRDLLTARLPAAEAYDATALVASRGRVVLAASPSVGPRGRERGIGAGLLVLDRPSYRGRAFLDIGDGSDDDWGYLVGGALVPRGWITDDVLLFSLAPQTVTATTVEHPRQLYLTWDLRSEEVRRVGQTSAPWRDSSWAAALLR
jgi:hypothetical protein